MMLLLVMGCAPAPDADPAESAPPDTAAGPAVEGGAEADVVYDPTVLHEVVVTLDPSDWAELRVQERNFYELFAEECMDGPWPSPYTWFAADVTVDGEALGSVAVRKKGLLGSVTADRPSLRVDVDRYQDGARYHGLRKLVLNNNNQDPSRLRTCLAHQWFADAGLVAPRCALAHVVVNGEDLGVYAQTEAIDEDLVHRREGAPPASLYEGTLSDFRDGWTQTFEPESDGADGHELLAVVAALEADDDALLAELDLVVDLDRFFTFWAAESLAGHWDGYNGNTNNFYVYAAAEDGRLRFIASGPDAVWDSRQPFGAGQPVWVATASALANRLIAHDEGRERYIAALERLLAEQWNEAARLDTLDAWKDLVAPVDSASQRTAIADLRDVVAARASDLEATLGGRFDPGALRGELCWTDVGVVTVDFAGTFGTYPGGDLYTGGTALPYYELAGVEYVALESGVSVGWADDGSGDALWLTISEIAPDTWLAPYVTFDPALAVDGGEVPIDGDAAVAMLLYNSPETGGQWAQAAYLGHGALRFEQAATDDGEPLVGRLEVTVLGSAE